MRTGWRMADGGRRKGNALRAVLLFCLAWMAPGAVLAQSGNDPTRPPAGFDTGVAEGDAADGGGGMMLQSVMISPTVWRGESEP